MIRYANKHDTQDIIRLLKEFAETSSSAYAYDPMKWSKTYIEAVLANIFAGMGFVLIDDKKTSILIAIKVQALWVEAIQLIEVMLHSKNKITMMKLIKEYVKIANKMKSDGFISQATMMSKKDANFEKLGMKKLETHWEI